MEIAGKCRQRGHRLHNGKLSPGKYPGWRRRLSPAGRMAGLVFVVPLAADHSGVVAAVLQLREEETEPLTGAGRLQVGPDAAVGGHPAGHGESTIAAAPGRPPWPGGPGSRSPPGRSWRRRRAGPAPPPSAGRCGSGSGWRSSGRRRTCPARPRPHGPPAARMSGRLRPGPAGPWGRRRGSRCPAPGPPCRSTPPPRRPGCPPA